MSIGIEISVTNTAVYEAQNIEKCVKAGFSETWMCSENPEHLLEIKTVFSKSLLSKKGLVHFLTPDFVLEKIETLTLGQVKPTERRVKGYRVKVNYSSDEEGENNITSNILEQLLKPKKF